VDATFSGPKLHLVVTFDEAGELAVNRCRVDGLIYDYALTYVPASAATTTTRTATAPGGSTGPGNGGAERAASGGRSAPSGLTSRQRASWRAVRAGRRTTVAASLQSPSEALDGGARRLVQNAALAAALVLLLVFPSQLFNSTYDRHHDRVEAGLARLLPWRRRSTPAAEGDATGEAATPGAADAVEPVEASRRPARVRVATYAAVVVIGGLLAELLDPHAGFDGKSAALFVAVVATTLVGALVGLLVGRGYRGARRLSADAFVDAVPSGLVVAGICVLVSRLSHFEPGYLYGLLGGWAFAVAMDEDDDGRSELAVVVTTLLLALVAWVAFVPVSRAANGAHPGFVVQLGDGLLSALFIGGIEGLLFGLVPLRFLPGHKVARWSWVGWAVAASVVSFVFVTVLLRPSSGYLGTSTTASMVVTYALFGVFGGVSVAFWGWFRLHPDPDPA
jgi:hypothetical protein